MTFPEMSSSVAGPGCGLGSVHSDACSSHCTSHSISGDRRTVTGSVKDAHLEHWACQPSVTAFPASGNKNSRKTVYGWTLGEGRGGKVRCNPREKAVGSPPELRKTGCPLSITPVTFTPKDPHFGLWCFGPVESNIGAFYTLWAQITLCGRTNVSVRRALFS